MPIFSSIWGAECCIYCLRNKKENDSHKYNNGVYDRVRSEIFASVIGSSVTIVTFAPLSVVKIHIQTSPFPLSYIYKDILRKNGLKGFWAGTGAGLIQAVPSSIIYMTTYERLKEQFASKLGDTRYENLIPGISGGIARTVCVTVMNPIDRIRTLQLNGMSESIASIMSQVYKQEGIKGLYKGWGNAILRDAPFSALYWYNLEQFKPITQSYAPGLSDMSVNFVSGSCAAFISTVFTHPFDVIKTQQQAYITSSSATTATAALSPVHSHSLLQLYRQQGFLALYKGLGLRLATVIPSSGLMISIYELVKSLGL